MDVDRSSVPRLQTATGQKKSGGRGKSMRKGGKDSLKVVYISSPMKVKTTASRFRSLVQELTGKDSDISEYMEGDGFDGAGAGGFLEMSCDIEDEVSVLVKEAAASDHVAALSSSSMDRLGQWQWQYSPASSDSFGHGEDALRSQMEEQYAGIFKSSYFYNPSQFDVLGSYDDVLL